MGAHTVVLQSLLPLVVPLPVLTVAVAPTIPMVTPIGIPQDSR
jgi:hypothetical protein